MHAGIATSYVDPKISLIWYRRAALQFTHLDIAIIHGKIELEGIPFAVKLETTWYWLLPVS